MVSKLYGLSFGDIVEVQEMRPWRGIVAGFDLTSGEHSPQTILLKTIDLDIDLAYTFDNQLREDWNRIGYDISDVLKHGDKYIWVEPYTYTIVDKTELPYVIAQIREEIKDINL